MAKMIQVRNVSDRLHRELTKRARASGETLTEYVERILEREVARPVPQELFDRLQNHGLHEGSVRGEGARDSRRSLSRRPAWSRI